jgi:hypothetical protein
LHNLRECSADVMVKAGENDVHVPPEGRSCWSVVTRSNQGYLGGMSTPKRGWGRSSCKSRPIAAPQSGHADEVGSGVQSFNGGHMRVRCSTGISRHCCGAVEWGRCQET